MTRFNTVAELHNGDEIVEAWTVQIADSLDYLIVAGADLAAAATLTITSRYHKVTGASNVDTITDASGASVGQVVWLYCTGTPTFRDTSVGAGNIIVVGGGTVTVAAGQIARFEYNGTNWVYLS